MNFYLKRYILQNWMNFGKNNKTNIMKKKLQVDGLQNCKSPKISPNLTNLSPYFLINLKHHFKNAGFFSAMGFY